MRRSMMWMGRVLYKSEQMQHGGTLYRSIFLLVFIANFKTPTKILQPKNSMNCTTR